MSIPSSARSLSLLGLAAGLRRLRPGERRPANRGAAGADRAGRRRRSERGRIYRHRRCTRAERPRIPHRREGSGSTGRRRAGRAPGTAADAHRCDGLRPRSTSVSAGRRCRSRSRGPDQRRWARFRKLIAAGSSRLRSTIWKKAAALAARADLAAAESQARVSRKTPPTRCSSRTLMAPLPRLLAEPGQVVVSRSGGRPACALRPA